MAGPAAVRPWLRRPARGHPGILLVIGFWTPLNIIAVCVAFVVLYSGLNLWSVYALMSKGRKVPPSAGATGL